MAEFNLFGAEGVRNMQRGGQQAWDDTGANIQEMRNEFTNNRAGRAYAGGDRQGAARMLAQGGNIDGARTLDNDRRTEERQTMQDQQTAEQLKYTRGREAEQDTAKKGEMLMKALDMLPDVSTPEQRRADLGHPIWQMFGITPDAVAQLAAEDLTDEAARAFKAKVKLQFTNRGGGGYDVSNADTGALIRSVEPTQRAPTGFEYGPDGDLSPIPGYVAGRAAIAGATRAPRVGRSGGGGGVRSNIPPPPSGWRPAGQ